MMSEAAVVNITRSINDIIGSRLASPNAKRQPSPVGGEALLYIAGQPRGNRAHIFAATVNVGHVVLADRHRLDFTKQF